MKKWLKEWWGLLLIVAFALSLWGGLIYGLAIYQPQVNEKNCIAFSDEINRPTQYRNSACYVEICEGYWVRKEDVIYSLDVCDE